MKAIILAALLSGSLPGQSTAPPAPQHEANFDAERKQANDLFVDGKVLDSLPLYEDLCRQDQSIAVFAERHGAGLLRKSGTLTDASAAKAMRDHGLAEIKRAQKLGDNSAYVQTVLSEGAKSLVGTAVTGLPLTVGYTYRGSPEAQASMKEAEAAFAREDVAAALKLYEKAATIDPKWYDPALYTGDMYFRLKDATNASIWFQKAIHIDPDRDTAYRYWGDALFKSGARDEAKAKYEQAVVAEPYARPSWLSLQQWATVTKTPLALPRVNVPKYTTTPDGVLQPDPGLDGDAARSSGRTSWLAYETCRVKHGGNVRNFSFATGADGSTHPNGYYHSLAEEYECLRATLADVRAHMVDGTVTEQGLDPSIKTVLQLDKDGVLQCWIVLNDADQGIRFDYAAFRNEHRDQLVAYIDRYIVQIAP